MGNKRVVVAMSGGVDSSVTAFLLKEQGYDVIGISMNLWEYSDKSDGYSGCCSLEDIQDARSVAWSIDIPHYSINFREEFKKEVVDYFIKEYMNGKTPNPCILCNDRLKFNHLMRLADEIGAEYIATGHYARNVYDDRRKINVLMKGVDRNKDQSYFLFGLKQWQLSRIIFPLGELTKSDVRSIASMIGLRVAEKKESQDICFITEKDREEFFKRYIPVNGSMMGKIVDKEGRVIGYHMGIHLYTIGQRKGIGLRTGERLYVTDIDPVQNTITVGKFEDLLFYGLIAENVNWIHGERIPERFNCDAVIRYRSKPIKSTVELLDEKNCYVIFNNPAISVTPGQAVVFYDGDVVLGGGWIKKGLR